MTVLGGGTQDGFIIWSEGGFIRVNRLGTTFSEQTSLEVIRYLQLHLKSSIIFI